MLSILIADDDAGFWNECLTIALARHGDFAIESAVTIEECKKRLSKKSFDLLILDISFGGDSHMEGIDHLPEMVSRAHSTPILMFSSMRDPLTVVRAKSLGARDFLSKSADLDEICARIIAAASAKQLADERREESHTVAREAESVFESAVMEKVFSKVVIARKNKSLDVILLGEPGTGKEVIATAIHLGRPTTPFIRLNCGAISRELVESELFGHVRGAFTGATADKIGKFEAAQGGDIFLDEVGMLSDHAQVALLRVLENREITRVGSNIATKINVRVIAATNEDLKAKVARGEFRDDLLSRLNGFVIELPCLRERTEDILPIAQHFIEKAGFHKLRVDDLCGEIFKSYHWPHNVRELRNVIHSALAASGGGTITVEHLPEDFIRSYQKGREPKRDVDWSADDKDSCTIRVSLADSLDNAQRHFLIAFIAAKRAQIGEHASQRSLAEALSIPRPTLGRKLRELGIL